MPGITLLEVGGDLVINVPDESTVIGRGQFLQVTDKRVSRSHALLEVNDGKLYITPTHTNPCFLRSNASKEQRILARDVKQLLDHGDAFGLLPDQFFYKVAYPQINGKDREEDTKKEDINCKEDNSSMKQEGNVANGDSQESKTEPAVKKDAEEEWDKAVEEAEKEKPSVEDKEEEETSDAEKEKDTDSGKKTWASQDDMAMPLEKKRVLPDWMVKVATGGTPSKNKTAAPKKATSTAVSKRQPGAKLTKSKADDDDDDEDFLDDEEEVYTPRKTSRGRAATKDSDDDYEEEPSDDDYMPEKPSRGRGGGRARRSKKVSDSDDDFSDDDDYSPKKSKPKPKTPKKPAKRGKGAKGKKSPAKPQRKTPQRSRSRKKNSDDDDDEEISLPRRRTYDDDDEDEEESPSRRPQRAARQKRGSYVDDPMIEEALEDFASDDDEDQNEDKDSDFEVEGEEDSGSDWEKNASGSQKQKAVKVSKHKGPPRGASKRVAASKKKPKGRRPSRTARDDSDDDDDIMEDDEPYVPRPSKRRGGAVSRDSESDEGQKKKRRREPCQYGKKCYRKNPVHFRTFCHPGDSSYDEDDKDGASPKDNTKRDKDSARVSPEKPSRPQRSTAGTRLVTHGMDEDDDMPDTYDYNDSFIDDGTQRTDDSAGDDSDYDAEEDVKELTKDAKKFLKNKKLAKPMAE